nr:hypothetical protein [Tanacetum cinerariifolium]
MEKRKKRVTITTKDLKIECEKACEYAPNLFTIRIRHGGSFRRFLGRQYVGGQQDIFDRVDIEDFSVFELDNMVRQLGYTEKHANVEATFLEPKIGELVKHGIEQSIGKQVQYDVEGDEISSAYDTQYDGDFSDTSDSDDEDEDAALVDEENEILPPATGFEDEAGFNRRKMLKQMRRGIEICLSNENVGTFRAKAKAKREIVDNHTLQHVILIDYVGDMQSTNSNTTVKIACDRDIDPSLHTRVFNRIYVCLVALKDGFRACRREVAGLYAESKSLWFLFLICLDDDIDLQLNSNFTFIGDRQKGIIPATKASCLALRWHLEKIHETWTQFRKKRTRFQLYTKIDINREYGAWRWHRDSLRRRQKAQVTELENFETSSEVTDLKKPIEDLAGQHSPNVLEMDDLESDNESIDTPLVFPFLDSDDELDDGEVLNELEGLENIGRNLVTIVRDVYVFIRSFTCVTNFIELEDIGEFIVSDMAKVVIGRPFRAVTQLEYDCFKGLISFTRIFDTYIFQMPRTIPRLTNFSWSKVPHILVPSQRYLMSGLKYSYEKNNLMYKNCLNLSPGYQVDEDMKKWLTRGRVSEERVT